MLGKDSRRNKDQSGFKSLFTIKDDEPGLIPFCAYNYRTDIFDRTVIKPNKSQRNAIESMFTYLEDVELGEEEVSFEIVYNSEQNKTNFQIVYPDWRSNEISAELKSKFDKISVETSDQVEDFFKRANSEHTYVSGVEFEFDEDHVNPIKVDFDRDPMRDLLNKITQNTGSNVDILYQVKFKPVEKYPERASLVSGLHAFKNSDLKYGRFLSGITGMFNYTAKDKIQELNKESVLEKNSGRKWETHISIIAVSKDEEELNNRLYSISRYISNIYSSDLQQLNIKQARTQTDLKDLVLNSLNRDIPDVNSSWWFSNKSNLKKPMILSQKSLSNLIHLPNGDVNKPSIDFTSSDSDKSTTEIPDV